VEAYTRSSQVALAVAVVVLLLVELEPFYEEALASSLEMVHFCLALRTVVVVA